MGFLIIWDFVGEIVHQTIDGVRVLGQQCNLRSADAKQKAV